MSTRAVRLTRRQEQALAALVQQRAIPFDLLQPFLGLSRSRTYEIVSGLRLAGLVRDSADLGASGNWIVPTRRGVTRYFGRSMPEWTPSLLWSVRGRAATEARLMLGATDNASWISERELSLASAERGAYPYDAKMLRTSNRYASRAGADVTDPVWAVRLDVARDSNPRHLATSLRRTVAQAEADGCTGVFWLCTGAHRPETVYTAAHGIRSDLVLTATTPAEVTGRYKRIRAVQSLPKGA